jgi:uncharacterized membrane protein
MLMNQPPGYYRDERGNEYYWDGQHRSYIPENPYQQFKSDVDRAAPWIVGALALPGLLPVVSIVIFLVGVAIWAVLQSPVLILLLLVSVAVMLFFAVYPETREAEEQMQLRGEQQMRLRGEQIAKAQRQQEEERREQAKIRKKEYEAKAEENKKRIRETEDMISRLMAEGIRPDFIGKTHDDFLPREDHPLDKVFAGMTIEERHRHMEYIMLNSSLKDFKPAVPKERYMEAQKALKALAYPPEEVEKVLKDLPPYGSVERYVSEALRRIGSRR